MEININLALNYIIQWEGPEVNISNSEPGGISKYGVSLQTYADYCKKASLPEPDANTISNMTEQNARDFYANDFLPAIRFNDLPSGVDIRLGDISINLGKTGACELLQTTLMQYPVSSQISNDHIEAISSYGANAVILALGAAWIAYKHGQANASSWEEFSHGWSNRNLSVTQLALQSTGNTMVTNRSAKPQLSRSAIWPTQAQAPVFYGNPAAPNWFAENTVDVVCPWTLHMDKDNISRIVIHKKCAASLTRILNNIWDAVGRTQEAIEKLHYDRYSGSYNYRPIRGGTHLSMHSYGCALDFDADENQQHSQHHLFQANSLIVIKFKEEGWIWGGDWSPGSIDAMHFQAARIH